jgi:nucleobase:cation symporter-1, NCS1 family
MGLLARKSLVSKGAEGVHGGDAFLDNDDLRPLKLADRSWTQWTYFSFWFSAVATVSNWYGASTAQALGLSMWESVGCQLGGQILIALVITANGRAGATYHIGFPVLNRTAFGIYGAWWPTFNRAVMAIVWNGVNAVQGGQCVYVMLHAIFPSIATIPNTMGSGSALTTGGMIGFVVFWIVTCAFLLIPVPKMRGLVYAKLVVFIISAIAMLAWTVSKAGGLGPVVRQPGTASGSEKAWLIVRFLMLGASSSATFASNASDFQRYAKKPSDVLAGNLIGFPVANLLVTIVGSIVCASSELIFGELVWNPLELLDRIQAEDYTPANRAGCFFIALCFTYCAVFSSIFENSLPAGNDIAALFPKYFTIKRGFFLCALMSFAINPWYLLV